MSALPLGARARSACAQLAAGTPSMWTLRFDWKRTVPGTSAKEREIPAHAHVAARMEDRAALPHDDLAGVDGLAAIALDAAELRVGVAPVARRALTLLVCHVACS
jgi:hypothetical protein